MARNHQCGILREKMSRIIHARGPVVKLEEDIEGVAGIGGADGGGGGEGDDAMAGGINLQVMCGLEVTVFLISKTLA